MAGIHRVAHLAGLVLALALGARAAGDSFSKSFRKFTDAAPGIDVFARDPSDFAPLRRPLSEARARLAVFLGEPLARGAIVICTSLEQKDSVTETRILRMGYRWALVQLTAEAANQQMLSQIKAQTGGQVPPGMLDRLNNPSPETKAASDARLVASTVQRAASAILFTTLAPEKEFRSSRLDDPGRSPLADWLDIGLVAHAAGRSRANLRLLQERIEEAFPLEDVLTTSRPYVAPSEEGAAGGDQFVVRVSGPPPVAGGPAPATGGPVPGPGGPRTSGPISMPKDVADRMMFDAQAAAFFDYVIEKAGVDKTRAMVQWNREGKPVRDFIVGPDLLGSDLEAIEKDWQTWIKTQKAAPPPGMRIMTSPGGPSASPKTSQREAKP